MKAVWDACKAAGLDPPPKVDKFFENGAPDEAGVRVEIEETDCVKRWEDDGRDGFDIDLNTLPGDVTVIRFYNSW